MRGKKLTTLGDKVGLWEIKWGLLLITVYKKMCVRTYCINIQHKLLTLSTAVQDMTDIRVALENSHL